MSEPGILALVRHGESTWLVERRFQGRADPPLTDEGRRQAMAIGARLAAPAAAPALPVPDRPPVAIWHSPLRRATQTAQAIHEAREADAPLRPVEMLAELSQGAWEGLTHAEVRRHYPRQLQGWLDDPVHHHAPGGESLPSALERAQRAILAMRVEAEGSARRGGPQATNPEDPEGSVHAEPVVGYEDPDWGGRPPAWGIVVAHDGILRCLLLALLRLGLERFWAFPFAPAAISVLDVGGDVARLRAHNLDEHVSAMRRR